MSKLSAANLKTKINERFNDNAVGEITAARARAMFVDIVDSFDNLADDPKQEMGPWSTTDTLPTVGSGTAGAIRKYDRWIVPSGGWTYLGDFFPQWSILEAMEDGATTFDQFKYPY